MDWFGRVIKKAPLIPNNIIMIALKAAKACASIITCRNESMGIEISMAKTMSILSPLLPNRFPRTMEGIPFRKAAMELANSGREVRMAREIMPKNVSPRLVISARSSAALARNGAVIRTTAAQAKKMVKIRNMDWS